MKIFRIAIICSVAIFSLQCTAQDKEKAAATNTNAKLTKQTIQKVELEELTRGTNRVLVFTPESKSVTLNGTEGTRNFSAAEWENVVKAVGAIDLAKIDTYEGPTTARFYDGALAATIRIHKDGKVYTSQSFDSGQPPKELAALYKLLAPAFTGR